MYRLASRLALGPKSSPQQRALSSHSPSSLLRGLLPSLSQLPSTPCAAVASRYIPSSPASSLRLFSCSAPTPASASATTTSTPSISQLDASRLVVSPTERPGQLLPPNRLVFGHSFTDHMLTAEWSVKSGWSAPHIRPYAPLALDPASCVFHYAFECFEGLKAYRDTKDPSRFRLFRPDLNFARLNKGAKRIALPTVDPAQHLSLLGELVRTDARFIPAGRGFALYLRPTLIGTQATLGIKPPGSAMLFVIASPVGPYFPTGFKAVRLEATDYAVRSWPGGVGDKKLGANYAPCIVPQHTAMSRGAQQNLWLFGPDQAVTEAGVMNFFAVIRDQNDPSLRELVTAPLDGTILEGVTRDSVLALARERLAKTTDSKWKVSERKLTMAELAEAADTGRLIEAFGSGTAAVVCPVRTITWQGREVDCGLQPGEEGGEVARLMKDWIEVIQYGEEEHEWSVVV